MILKTVPQVDPKIAAALERERQAQERKDRKLKEQQEKKEADKLAREAYKHSAAGQAKASSNNRNLPPTPGSLQHCA